MDFVPEQRGASAEMSWGAWTLMYCRELAAAGSESYARQHQYRVEYLMQSLGLSSFADITPHHVLQWRDDLSENGQPRASDGARRQGGCGASALKTHIAAMKAMYDWLIRIEAIPPRANPFVGVRTPPRVTQDQRALSSDEIRKLIEYAEADEAGPQRECEPDGSVRWRSSLYRVLGVCGYRVNEAARLRWRDVDLGADPARINLPAAKGKARDGGTAMLPEPVRASLKALKAATTPEPADLVWGWLSGNTGTVRKVLRRDCKRAGVDDVDARGRRVGWHAFRRGVGSELARIGVNPRYAQAILRHRDVRTTLKHYTNADDGKILEAGNALAGQHLREKRTGNTGKSQNCVSDDADDRLVCHSRPGNHEQQRDSDHPTPEPATSRVVDRMDVGGRAAASATSDERGIGNTGSSPVSPIPTPEARLLGLAAELLSLAAEIVARSPRKGTVDEQLPDNN